MQRSNMFGFQGPQLVLISPPRPWYGRPVRPTIEPPRALLSGNLDLEVIASRIMIWIWIWIGDNDIDCELHGN